MFPISFIFNPVRTLLHFFALPKNSTLLFSSDSALRVKKHNHRGGKGYVSDPQVLAVFFEIQPGQSGQHESPVTNHESRITKLGLGVSQNRPKMEGLSLGVSAFDLESLAESAELELAMVFVLGRLVRPLHGLR
jgi:hypothetical protein